MSGLSEPVTTRDARVADCHNAQVRRYDRRVVARGAAQKRAAPGLVTPGPRLPSLLVEQKGGRHMVSDLIVARPNVQVTVYGEVTLLDAPHPKPNLSRMKRTRVAVYTRDEWTCQGCDRTAIDQPADVLSGRYAPMLPDGEWLELDHIIPRALGGPYVAENLQALCTTCNREKWASTERVNWEGRIRRAIQIMQRQSWNEATARRAVDILLGGDRREGIG